jgi:hypothetical protein
MSNQTIITLSNKLIIIVEFDTDEADPSTGTARHVYEWRVIAVTKDSVTDASLLNYLNDVLGDDEFYCAEIKKACLEYGR